EHVERTFNLVAVLVVEVVFEGVEVSWKRLELVLQHLRQSWMKCQFARRLIFNNRALLVCDLHPKLSTLQGCAIITDRNRQLILTLEQVVSMHRRYEESPQHI